MSLWFNDFQFEEEFNDDRNFATNISGKKSGGNLATFLDNDWFATELPKNTEIKVTFEGSNYNLGIFNFSWFSYGMKELSNQNISISTRDGTPSHTYTFNSGESGGIYYYKIMPFSSEFYKPDVYLITIEPLNSTSTAPSTMNPVISLSKNEISISEGNTGFKNVDITLTMDQVILGDVIVHYTVRSGTAHSVNYDSDYGGTIAGNAFIRAGETSVTVNQTQIWSDTQIEPDEYFWVDFDDIHVGAYDWGMFAGGVNVLSTKVNIIDDDAPEILLSQNNISINEGDKNSYQDIVLTFTLDHAVSTYVDFLWSPRDGTATTDNEDYLSFFGNVIFQPGETSKTINLGQIKGDSQNEPDEYFWVDFSNVIVGFTNYTFAGGANSVSAKINILNDDIGDHFTGTADNDALTGGSGNDIIDGGLGIDTVIITNPKADYTLTPLSNGFALFDTLSRDGTDTFTNIERIKFSDISLALDLNGNAGITAKILGAAFGSSSVSNEPYSKQYVDIGLNYLDNGMSYSDLMLLALNARLGNGFSNTDEVNLIYQNLVGSPPSTDDLNYWVGTITSEQFTQSSLAVMAGDHSLNNSNINLVGLAQTGIEFF